MTDFPEKIWLSGDAEYGVDIEHSPVPVAFSQNAQYIRADLVPQWRPISELRPQERVILLYDNGHIDNGWIDDRENGMKVSTSLGRHTLDRFTHWMPIPDVPE